MRVLLSFHLSVFRRNVRRGSYGNRKYVDTATSYRRPQRDFILRSAPLPSRVTTTRRGARGGRNRAQPPLYTTALRSPLSSPYRTISSGEKGGGEKISSAATRSGSSARHPRIDENRGQHCWCHPTWVPLEAKHVVQRRARAAKQG